MLFNCHACKAPLFQAVEVDSMPITLEQRPVGDGPIILMDADLTDRPRAIWGKPEDVDWWRTLGGRDGELTPQDVPRYRKHDCPERSH